MALRTYSEQAPFYVCSECNGAVVIDRDTHDRWHAEREAQANPDQEALF